MGCDGGVHDDDGVARAEECETVAPAVAGVGGRVDIFERLHVLGAEQRPAGERVDLAARGELDAGGGGAGAEGDAGPLARGGCEVGVVQRRPEDGADFGYDL